MSHVEWRVGGNKPKTLKGETKGGLHIRWAVFPRDLPEMLFIEKASSDDPLIEADFECYHQQKRTLLLVAEINEKIVGFMIYKLQKPKLPILNFAVHPDYRRQGIGRQMAEKIISKIPANHCDGIVIDVREKNLDAQLFLRACGFKATGINREFYPDTGEDAFVFEYKIPTLNCEIVSSGV